MKLHALREADELIDTLPKDDVAKILTAFGLLAANRSAELKIKQLRGRIKELVIKQYRIIFFREKLTIYVIDIFRKQSKKTPQRIIQRAEKIYKEFQNKHNE